MTVGEFRVCPCIDINLTFRDFFFPTEKSILDRFIYSGHSRQPLSKVQIALASAHPVKIKKGERLRKTDQTAEPGPKPTVGPAGAKTDGQERATKNPRQPSGRVQGAPVLPCGAPKYSTPKEPTFDPGTGGDLQPERLSACRFGQPLNLLNYLLTVKPIRAI